MNFISDAVAAMRRNGCTDEDVEAFVSSAVALLNELEWKKGAAE